MRIFTLLIIIVFSLACTSNIMDDQNPDIVESIPNSKSNYLALGDSYTIGQSVSEVERFPVILTNQLNKMGHSYNAPRIIAKTGWTTDELASAIVDENIKDTFDLVTLLIGVNNQYRGRDVENFRKEFKSLLNQAIDFAAGNKDNVIVISIPDWGVSPFAANKDREQIAMEIDLFNKIKKEETEDSGVRFVNITGISRSALNDPGLIAEDGLHFSGKMHELWVDEIIKQCFR